MATEHHVCPTEATARDAFERRFWAKVNKAGPTHGALGTACWIWTRALNEHGYGAFRVGGRAGRTRLAHRVAYELARGPVPDGLGVLHRCDVPACVNPDHLFVGTQRANIADMVAKGRQSPKWGRPPPGSMPAGERHWNARLTDEQVAAIRAGYQRRGDGRRLAAEYGVSPVTISGIVNNRHRRRGNAGA